MNKPTTQAQDEIIRRRARESFERSVTGLDQATGNRLRLMRREALSTRRPVARVWALPVAAAAVAVLALGLAWRAELLQSPPTPDLTGASGEVSAIEFPSEEDADLYAWLGEAPVAPAEGESL